MFFRCERGDVYKRQVQGRCTVQQHGVTLDNGLEAVPDFGLCALDHLAGGLDVVGNALSLIHI